MPLTDDRHKTRRFTLFGTVRAAAEWLHGLGPERSAWYMARNAEWITEARRTPSVWEA